MKNMFKKDSPEGRVQAEIQNTEFKKNSMISAVSAEKLALEQQKINCFRDMGETAYRQHLAKEENYHFQPFFTQIEQIESQVMEKERKINEIATRYDEEIGLLTSTLNAITQTQASIVAAPAGNMVPPVAAGGFCENCGSPSAAGDAFCQSCGKPLG